MSDTVVLNEGNTTDEVVGGQPLLPSEQTAEQIVGEMRTTITQLKGKFMSADGKMVNYAGLAESQQFQSYLQAAKKLKQIDISILSQDELKCLFVNVYNSLTVHAVVYQFTKGGLPQAPKDVDGFWRIHCYNVGGIIYSLDDMEHGVLRSNKGPPSGSDPQFDEDDVRAKMIVKQLDPRIHFALNCGALSCPPIRVYTVDRLDEQLQTASLSFLLQEVAVVTKQDGGQSIEMSRLLLWYRTDFGRDDSEVLNWIISVVGDKIDGLQEASANSTAIVYKEYMWDTNNSN